MNRFLRIATTWSLVSWTVVSLVRLFLAYSRHDSRLIADCTYAVEGIGYWNRACIEESELVYSATKVVIWDNWWELTIILCLLWFMVRWSRK